MVEVYSTPGCAQCVLTMRVMTNEGIPHREVDLSTDPVALERVRALGYQSAPVVITPKGDHWSGFRPDRIKELA